MSDKEFNFIFRQDGEEHVFCAKSQKEALAQAVVMVDDWFLENQISPLSVQKIPGFCDKIFKRSKGFFEVHLTYDCYTKTRAILRIVLHYRKYGNLAECKDAMAALNRSKFLQAQISNQTVLDWLSDVDDEKLKLIVQECVPPAIKVATYLRHFHEDAFYQAN